MRRHKLHKKGSRRMFTKHAHTTHVRNLHRQPMRGGIRL